MASTVLQWSLALSVAHQRVRHQGGVFALLELLVALAIIAVLNGLRLQTVQKERESAAWAQYINNLKKIGLAFSNHHSQFGDFPLSPSARQPEPIDGLAGHRLGRPADPDSLGFNTRDALARAGCGVEQKEMQKMSIGA